MPPHCDTMDGPVVKAARRALEAGDVQLVLPYVPKAGEAEVLQAFDTVMRVRKESAAARELADRYFFETVVRIHRVGEGAAYTGLKPAGLDVGPVIPEAEKAIETGDPAGLVTVLTGVVQEEVHKRLHAVMHLKRHADVSVDDARAYVGAMLGLQVWAHALYVAARSEPHAGEHGHGHHAHAA